MIDNRCMEVKVLHYRNFLNPTKEIFRSALKDVIIIIEENYNEIVSLGLKAKERNNYIEKLIHKTKENPSPKYLWFDEKYFQMPSYFRRNVIAEALGKENKLKPIDASLWSLVVAKVPQLRARMLCVLDTLIKVNECLATLCS